MRMQGNINTALLDKLSAIDVRELPKMENMSEIKASNVSQSTSSATEIEVTADVLGVGKPTIISDDIGNRIEDVVAEPVVPDGIGNESPSLENSPRDAYFFIDEMKYSLSEEIECAIMLHVGSVPLMVAKMENSRMFHIMSQKDASYRLGYAFLGHPCKNPKENEFHDVDWNNVNRAVRFIVVPKTPKNTIIVNKLGITHSQLAIGVSKGLDSWFRSRFEDYVTESDHMKSFNTLQQMIFRSLVVDQTEAGIRWVKGKDQKRIYAFRKSTHGKHPITDLQTHEAFGYSFIGQDKGGVRGQWMPHRGSNGQNMRAPTKHGNGGMLSLSRNLIHRLIDNNKEVNPEMLQ